MHEDEGLDCKVLSVMIRHFKNIFKYFSFGICPLALLGFEKPGLFMVKLGSSSQILDSCGRWPLRWPTTVTGTANYSQHKPKYSQQ